MKEIWIEIEGFPYYKVSNLGNVVSFRFNKVKLLKQQTRKDYYKFVILYNENGKYTISTHKLVYESFNKVKISGHNHHIDHINNDRGDNRLINLQLLSARENSLKINIKNKTSRYKGVSWSSTKKRWLAHIRINSKQKRIGSFYSEEEAYEAYIKARKELNEL